MRAQRGNSSKMLEPEVVAPTNSIRPFIARPSRRRSYAAHDGAPRRFRGQQLRDQDSGEDRGAAGEPEAVGCVNPALAREPLDLQAKTASDIQGRVEGAAGLRSDLTPAHISQGYPQGTAQGTLARASPVDEDREPNAPCAARTALSGRSGRSAPGAGDRFQRAQEAVYLRRPCELRRLGDDVFDPHPPRGKLPLQPCPSAPDLIRVPQRTHALIERSPGSWSARIARHGPLLGDPPLTGRPF